MHKDHVDMLPYMAAFAVVVETGSFIDASEKLGVSASAVSRQISKLERMLSLRLIERSTRHLKVNADGVKVYYHCKELLRFSSRVFDLKDELGQPQGLIKIAAPKMMNGTLNQLMPEFLRRFPEINVQFIFDGGQGDLISDGVDLSIKILIRHLWVWSLESFSMWILQCVQRRSISIFTEFQAIPLSWRDIAVSQLLISQEANNGSSLMSMKKLK